MANSQNILIDLGVTNNNVIQTVTKVRQEIQMTQTVVNVFNQHINNTFNNLNKIKPVSFVDNLSRVVKGFSDFTLPGAAFEQTLADLSAQTGITGSGLETLGEQARKTGQNSGMGATQALKAYQALASQVNVARIGLDGLNALQAKTMVLAKASGLEIGSAASVLTATIQQFGLEASQADRVINVLAAGARYGAMGMPELSVALTAVGDAAQTVGISVESTAGALGVLSRSNLKGAEAGRSLKNILLSMQDALGIDLSQSSLAEGLENLRPKLNDAAYLSRIFGEENVAALRCLVENASAVGEITEKVTDSNVAWEQAALKNQTVAARMERMKQSVEDLKISLFNLTGGAGGYITAIGDMVNDISKLLPLFRLMGDGLSYVTNAERLHAVWAGIVKTATTVWAGIQGVLNASLWACPLTWIIAAITALVAAVAVVCSRITGWGSLWKGIVGFMKYSFQAFVDTIKLYWNTWIDGFMIGINAIMKGWYRFKNAMGMGDEGENNAALAKIDADTDARKQAIADGAKQVLESRQKAMESLGNIRMGWKGSKTEKPAGKSPGPATVPGISSVSLPGTDNASLIPTYQSTSPAAVQQSTESAVAGGTRSTHVVINLGKLMDQVNIYAQEFRDGLNDLDGKVLDSLTRVLNIAQSNVI